MGISVGTKVPILAAVGARAFRFTGGVIAVEGGPSTSVWSSDDGLTWSTTPPGGRAAPGPGLGAGESAARYYGATHILSLSRLPAANGNWAVRRSSDDWVTVASETSTIDLGSFTAYVPPGGPQVPSQVFDRGVLQLASGDLVAALYGTYAADTAPVEMWPKAFGSKKARLTIFKSTDSGATWSVFLTLMNNQQWGRGTDPSPDPLDVEAVPMVSQEGTTINDMVIAPNGRVITFAQSGSRISTQEAGAPPTPLYYTDSTATMGSNTTPLAMSLDKDHTYTGSAPSLAVTTNNFIVLGTSYPTTRLYSSADNAATWTNETTLCTDLSGTRVTVLPLTAGRALVIYKDTGLPGAPFTAVQVTLS